MITSLPTLPDRVASAKRQSPPVRRIHGTKMSETTLRIGAVSYLNSKPLVEGLVELLPETPIRLDFPSRLADELTSGNLDVALIPSIEYFRGRNYKVISDACVAAHGPVLSVKLYSRVPWGQVKTLALDEGSRTSATLARILLAERHGVFPKLEPLPLNHRTEDTNADSILLIGDRAILPPNERFLGTWDLGEEWCQWTGLPFVFAMWVANVGSVRNRPTLSNGIDPDGFKPSIVSSDNENHESEEDSLDFIERSLGQARDWGVSRISQIAEREAPKLGLTLPITMSYLTKNLQYHLGPAERSGLKMFYKLAAGLELAPANVELSFRSSKAG